MNERLRRVWSAAEAKVIGHGGIGLVSKATGLARTTISNGIKELDATVKLDLKRVRKSGGGRQKIVKKTPEIEAELLQMLEPTVRGEPESPILWTVKSLRNLAAELEKRGYKMSRNRVAELLKKNAFSLQANRKTDEGKSHPDRDAQFQYIHDKVIEFQSATQPVISVDTKKKELVGNFKNPGRAWKPTGEADRVKVYDFPSDAEGKAIPYGVYDITQNLGWVSVGTNHDTAEFAVETIRKWWYQMGNHVYPKAQQLLITADGGGSNGSRVRLWKKEIQDFANDSGLEISICHYPPGTSKWNKIEHRLFSFITQNWRGRPLITHEVVVNLIGATKTTKGLSVGCQLDPVEYEKGRKVSDLEFNNINLIQDNFHGEWNYKIVPDVIKI
jgi:transposase